MENWLTQLGAGTKQLTERYADYPAAAHYHQPYYGYEPSSPARGHAASSDRPYGGGGHKSNAAMSALTLLAFLFFLHILQQCLKEHMTAMSTPHVMIVSAGRQTEQIMPKTSNKDKSDKAGPVRGVAPPAGNRHGAKLKDIVPDEHTASNAPTENDSFLTRIATAEHTPKQNHRQRNKNVNYVNRSSIFDGFVSAMDKK